MANKEPPGKIRIRLGEMIAKRRFEQKDKITYRNINEATGISISTLSDWVNEKREQDTVLAWLCEYLKCQPGDLLIYIRDESKQEIPIDDDKPGQ